MNTLVLYGSEDPEELSVFQIENLLSDCHFQFVNLPQVGKRACFLAIEYLVPVEIDLQTTFV